MREFISAVEEIDEENAVDANDGKVPVRDENDEIVIDPETGEPEMDYPHVLLKLDGRVMRSYHLEPQQLAFMMSALGRGQSSDQRFASIINIMMESLRDSDRDYLEGRMLTRDRKARIKLEKVEEMFGYLVEQWFARPTQRQSDSAESSPTDTTS